jgi:DNA (cytosine-5)-methyltransferase 1
LLPPDIPDPDQAWLRSTEWPGYDAGHPTLHVVDLFAGCGGMTLGLAHAAHLRGERIAIDLAVDFEPDATAVYTHNFAKLDPRVETAPVEDFFDGALGAALTPRERALRREIGYDQDFVVGGPPCQGHSDLNNHSRRDDPRNAFYARMARAAEVLSPRSVVIENVPTVQHDRQGIVEVTRQALQKTRRGVPAYRVAEAVVTLHDLGVPQRRRRHLLLAIREDHPVEPADVLGSLGHPPRHRDLAWAIADLVDVGSRRGLDVPSGVSEENRRRIAYLHEHGLFDLPDAQRPDCHRYGGHTYTSVYGRLMWDQPAQTITSGYGSMGQGRYVHPDLHRTLTPHEAARLQFFPDWFDFTAGGTITRRGAWATMIGNAVPPRLMTELATILLT